MQVGNYQLGDCLGRGAFASVYRGLNWMTGETVAVKQVRLGNMPPSELKEIMAEIDLLKNLRHSNIVKYKGSEKTRDYLYIILEYCENGSLQHICKRFGKFPEGLVGVYISQILDGLIYLHEQGVIHRDIKGANILTTKDGSVKLADFGVATRTGSLITNNAVVGSPYWMAPEVIDQSGATTASDIWSVGAVVVELLEGKPPYHYLDPMPALFRIVQDDCPPLPDCASPVVKDFLMQCFQKDVNLRVSARKLSRHPWMISSRRQTENLRTGGSMRSHAQAVKSVKEWNDALNEPSKPVIPAGPHSKKSTQESNRSETSRSSRVEAVKSDMGSRAQSEVMREANLNSPMRPPRRPVPKRLPAVSEPEIIHDKKTFTEIGVIHETENWDDDFEDGISKTLIAAMDKGSHVTVESDFNEDEFATIRAPPVPLVPHTFSKHVAANGGEKAGDKLRSPAWRGTEIESDSAYDDASSRVDARNRSAGPPAANSPAMSKAPDLLRYMEEASVDEFAGLVIESGRQEVAPLKLAPRYLASQGTEESDLEEDEASDPFGDLEQEAKQGTAEFDANIARDKHARLNATIIALFDTLSIGASEDVLIGACDELEILLTEHPEMKVHAMAAHGALTIVELLEFVEIRDIIGRLLGLLNVIIHDDVQAQESLCLMGAMPIAMPFCSKRYPHHVRVEAAHLIFTMCSSSDLTLQFVLSCRGLRVLVALVDDDYTQQRDLVWLGIACVHGVLELQSPVSRNDFCRMLAKEGLLEPLSSALLSVLTDEDATEQGKLAIEHILEILLIYSSSDLWLKQQVSVRNVLRRLLQACRMLKPKRLTKLLKVVKNLTMSPSLLDAVENCNTIEVLIHILATSHAGAFGTEISNQVLNAMYNLCRLNLRRQEEAAQAGLIPHLIRIARTSTPLKQFALPILCDMAHASKATRKMLSQHSGIVFFLELLQDANWQSQALESICVWLNGDVARIEDQLLRPDATHALLVAFVSSKSLAFETLLETYLKIFKISAGVTLALGKQTLFLKRLGDRLQISGKAIVRLNTLRVCKAICDAHPEVHTLVRQSGLLQIVQRLSKDDSAVLVRELAREITIQLEKPSTAPSMVAKDAHRTVRRAASESNVHFSPTSSHHQTPRKHRLITSSNSKGSNRGLTTPSSTTNRT